MRATTFGIVVTAITEGIRDLFLVGVGVGNKALFFFEKDNENLGIDVISLGNVVDDLSGGATIEGLVGKTNKVPIFNMINEAAIDIVTNFSYVVVTA